MKDIELNYKTIGEGKPVIILHGLMGMLDNWKTFGRKLSESYKVYLVDQRNHGRSPWTDEFNYDLLAGDLHKLIKSENIESCTIIGHSMGGKTAMKYAQLYPMENNKFIIVDISPKEYNGNHKQIFEALFALNLDEIENRTQADDVLSAHIGEFGIRQFLLKNLTRKKEGGYGFKMNLDSIYNNYAHILEAMEENPTKGEFLFVRGTKSNYIMPDDYNLIAKVFPRSSIDTLDAGHWVHAEQPEALLKISLEFIG